MKTLTVQLDERSYEICIGSGLLSEPDQIMPWIEGQQAFVITDDMVGPLYLEKLYKTLSGKKVTEYIIDHGEANKNLVEMERIFAQLLQVPCDRDTTIIALGGGVVGDMAGFAAACYQRGVPFIQIPTSLLAQVDSSVGGKTGVNHQLGKNMIGAFYQPRRVLIDTATLDTLDRRQFSAGMAEVIKYGAINDHKFFEWLENNIKQVMARDSNAIEFIIERSCANKAKIVAQDEREQGSGMRALLNLGHTFAHAIESGTGYGKWLHGEAVATGIAMAAAMSTKMGWLKEEERVRIESLLKAAELPVEPFKGLTASKMLELMKVDKKVRDGELRLILLKGIGGAEIVSEYSEDALVETLEYFNAP